MSCRVRVIGGPWPERIGCEGVTVDDPGDGIYPFDKPLRDQRVILLDDDPINPNNKRSWTCCMKARDLEFLPDGSVPLTEGGEQ